MTPKDGITCCVATSLFAVFILIVITVLTPVVGKASTMDTEIVQEEGLSVKKTDSENTNLLTKEAGAKADLPITIIDLDMDYYSDTSSDSESIERMLQDDSLEHMDYVAQDASAGAMDLPIEKNARGISFEVTSMKPLVKKADLEDKELLTQETTLGVENIVGNEELLDELINLLNHQNTGLEITEPSMDEIGLEGLKRLAREISSESTEILSNQTGLNSLGLNTTSKSTEHVEPEISLNVTDLPAQNTSVDSQVTKNTSLESKEHLEQEISSKVKELPKQDSRVNGDESNASLKNIERQQQISLADTIPTQENRLEDEALLFIANVVFSGHMSWKPSKDGTGTFESPNTCQNNSKPVIIPMRGRNFTVCTRK